MDSRLIELIRDDPRYSYEAYEFVCDSVTYTQGKLGRARASEGAEAETEPAAAEAEVEDHHVSGGELLRGACEMAVREFGLMAPIVFKLWGIRTTDDFGAIVFRLIAAERLSKSDQDDIDDFRDLFDLEKALTEGYTVELGDVPRRSER